MRPEAKFGAVAGVDARLISDQPQLVVLVRDQVTLPAQARRPERVQNVSRVEVEDETAANRNVQLVRSNDAVVRVLEVPPPLVAGDVDHNVALCLLHVRLGLEDRAYRGDGEQDGDGDRA